MVPKQFSKLRFRTELRLQIDIIEALFLKGTGALLLRQEPF